METIGSIAFVLNPHSGEGCPFSGEMTIKSSVVSSRTPGKIIPLHHAAPGGSNATTFVSSGGIISQNFSASRFVAAL